MSGVKTSLIETDDRHFSSGAEWVHVAPLPLLCMQLVINAAGIAESTSHGGETFSDEPIQEESLLWLMVSRVIFMPAEPQRFIKHAPFEAMW